MNKLIILLLISFILPQSKTDSLTANLSLEKDKDIAWKLNMFPIVTGRMSMGQFYNDKPFKAIFLLGMKSYWIKELNTSIDINDIGDRNRSFWWLLILIFIWNN